MNSSLSMRFYFIIAALLSHVAAVLPVIANGNKFYQLQPDYAQPPESFSIVGVNYQPGGLGIFDIDGEEDALSNAQICQRDAFLFKRLGINTIHVSAASPWINHDQCMTILNNAGIYVVIDINLPDSEIDPKNPAGTYTHGFLNDAFGLIDAFKTYPNVLGFLAAESLVNSTATAQQDPKYVRALVRDLKQYINRWSNRTIPVGYGAGSDATWRYAMYEYLQCDASSGNSTVDAFAQADFIGLQDFSWCGNNNWDSSDYGEVYKQFNGSSIPIIFTGYGCNTVKPRTFKEAPEGLYGPLSEVLSGGFVYEYTDETGDGLVTVDADENVTLKQDFENLRTALSSVTYSPSTLPASAASITGSAAVTAAPQCNRSLLPSQAQAFNWDLSLPPCPASDLLLTNGGNLNVGSPVDFPSTQLTFTWALLGVNGSTLVPTNTYASSYQINYQTNVPKSARKTVLAYGATPSTSSAQPSTSTAQSTNNADADDYSNASASGSFIQGSSFPSRGGNRKTSNGAASTKGSWVLLAGTSMLGSLLFILV